VNARVVDRARVPRNPSAPNVTRNLGVGLFAGLLLGVALVLLRERTDASIRVPGTLPLYGKVRELGVIPSSGADAEVAARTRHRILGPLAGARALTASGRGIAPVELATWNRKGSPLAESFRATLTSILMSAHDGQDRRVLLVTSPLPREGKSTLVTNLAVALAEMHQRVLVIDADLRRPRVHAIFGQSNTWGLSDLLADETPCADYPADALARTTEVPGLFSIPSGLGGADAIQALYSSRMAELLDRLRQEFDAILIDTPPVLTVADARILSRLADGVVLVVRAGQTQRDSATMAMNMFEADGIQVLGTVLNDWNPRHTGAAFERGGHGYYYRDASNA
jgi:capsular exopolysaccharide synthesis family protein